MKEFYFRKKYLEKKKTSQNQHVLRFAAQNWKNPGIIDFFVLATCHLRFPQHSIRTLNGSEEQRFCAGYKQIVRLVTVTVTKTTQTFPETFCFVLETLLFLRAPIHSNPRQQRVPPRKPNVINRPDRIRRKKN